MTKSQQKFKNWSLFLLFYTLIVILWGAWVRISHSGDGCGDTWPLCQGQVIPEAESYKTWIEFAHRLKSGLFGFVVLGLYLWARKLYPKESSVRTWAFLTLIFTISEALLGAKLVLFGLVTDNDSPARALVMSLHMINSLALVAAITLMWDTSHGAKMVWKKREAFVPGNFSLKKIVVGFALTFLLIATSGAIASLSSTLFPSESLLQGLQEDISAEAHYLVRLRGLHPLFGILLGGSIAALAYAIGKSTPEKLLRSRSQRLFVFTSVGIVFGMLTLVLLYPTWMKLTHLLLAHGIWIHLNLWLNSFTRSQHSLD
ncbi:MAG: COX15/CtaA family protein [Proteobacteria bacterium]|jgi:cytochrome c oxidase assembly protein subunit 15|nr:COX15/CtaA family protein [Pseudomonadota bacterium]